MVRVQRAIRNIKTSDNIDGRDTFATEYGGMTANAAFLDFSARIREFEKVYQPLGSDPAEMELSWMRLTDYRRFTVNNLEGYRAGRIVQFLMNMHVDQRCIYLTRHGQSEYNRTGQIGGDSGLSPDGRAYAIALANWARNVICTDPTTGAAIPARLWTSTMHRTLDTAADIPHPLLHRAAGGQWQEVDSVSADDGKSWVQMRPRRWPNLCEVFAGQFDGMTYKEIEETHPEEFHLRQQNKLAYRYPRGESYLDCIHRLEPVIIELERLREPVLVVGHQAILRLIHAYYTGVSRSRAPSSSIPLNTIIKLTPQVHAPSTERPYGCSEERFLLRTRHVASDGQDEPQGSLLTKRRDAFDAAANRGELDDPPSH